MTEDYIMGFKDAVKAAQDLTQDQQKSMQDGIDALTAMTIPQVASAASVYPISRRFQR